jgi:hypothetical protein
MASVWMIEPESSRELALYLRIQTQLTLRRLRAERAQLRDERAGTEVQLRRLKTEMAEKAAKAAS